MTPTNHIVLVLNKISDPEILYKNYVCYGTFSSTIETYDNIIWFERIDSLGIDTLLIHNASKNRVVIYSVEDVAHNVVLDQ